MYIPKHFELDAERAGALLREAVTAEIVAAYPEGPEATLLPVQWIPGGAYGSFACHVTRTNPLWKKAPLGEVLAIVSGPDAYIDPMWYPEQAEHPTVPTWNYVTVHAYGELIVHDDSSWTREHVVALSSEHGYDTDAVAPRDIDTMLRSIVGIELRITRVLAKAKLSQHKSPEHVEAVVAHLRERGGAQDAGLAEAMDEISVPHAHARRALVEGIRAERGER